MAILDFQVVREQDMSAEMDQRIRDALCVSFVKDAAYFSQKRGWKGSFPHWSVVGLDAGGFPAVHAGIIERDILVDGSELRILGVQNVYVLPEFRGQGLVAPLMQLVVDEGRRRAIATGLLFCKPVVEKVYIRLGWKRLEVQKIFVSSDKGERQERILAHDALFYYPLCSDVVPSGVVDLCGPDW